MEVGNAARANPSLAGLRLGDSVFSRRTVTERAAMLAAKALHVTPSGRLCYAQVGPMRGETWIKLLCSPLGLGYRRSTGPVTYVPPVIAEPKVNALEHAVLRDDQTRRPPYKPVT
jgi:hypothetical protein